MVSKSLDALQPWVPGSEALQVLGPGLAPDQPQDDQPLRLMLQNHVRQPHYYAFIQLRLLLDLQEQLRAALVGLVHLKGLRYHRLRLHLRARTGGAKGGVTNATTWEQGDERRKHQPGSPATRGRGPGEETGSPWNVAAALPR
eukprot:scaffold1928_cov381-Prasinococcus_capsulatus_cf.AAC.6